MKSVLLLWDNLGPPHLDRIEAARAHLNGSYDVIGAGIFAASNEYDWTSASPSDNRITLFADRQAFSSMRFLRHLLGLVRQRHVSDVFLCNYDRGYVLAAALLLRLFGRQVFTMVDSKFDDKPRRLIRELLKALYLLPYSGVMVASTRSRDYMTFLGVKPNAIRPGYNTIDTARLRRQAAGEAERPFDERPFVIVARLVDKKNLGVAIRAFAVGFAESRARRLIICGSGPLLEELQKLAADLGVSSLIEFPGFLQTDDIAKTIKTSLALILPSTEEQFGQVIAEAQALSTPVIVSLACGARDELVKAGVNGFIFEPDNIEGLSEAMTRLSEDESLWQRMRMRAAHFSTLADTQRFADAVGGFIGAEEATAVPQGMAAANAEPDKLNICFVATSASRTGAGVAESARTQAIGLLARYPFSIAISMVTLTDEHFAADAGAWRGVTMTGLKHWGRPILGFSPLMFFALLRSRADIVHVHGVWQLHCLAVWLWSVVTGRPYVVSPHGMLEAWMDNRSPRRKKMAAMVYQDRFLKDVSGFHLLTEKEREDIARYAADKPVAVIPNFVTGMEDDGSPPPWWQGSFEEKIVFLFFGRIHEKKGCIELCNAWDLACKEDPEFRNGSALVFCGWNDGFDGFEGVVAEMARSHGNVHYAGGQYGLDRSRSFMSADVFVLPSKSEGLPMAVLEAWTAGLPVMMTAECNLPDGFKAGAAVEISLKQTDLAHALISVFKMSPEEHTAMGKVGRDLVSSNFSADGVVAPLMQFYEETIAGHMARRKRLN